MYILNVAVDVPLYRLFSYSSDKQLAIGTRVAVQLGSKTVTGFVWDNQDIKIDFEHKKLKSILEVFSEVLADDARQLIQFTANYYHYPLGQTIFGAIPNSWRKPKVNKDLPGIEINKLHTGNNIELNEEQLKVLSTVSEHFNQYYPCLLYGITGSGKTEVYLALIEKALARSVQVLVLVPEINLTPQLLERFKRRFPQTNIHVLTSHATSKQRLIGYVGAAKGEMQIILGTRLSVFTPFKSLGLIIVDEEHDQSFKQQEGLRYHARDLAIWRASTMQIPIVLGSATPSLEILYNYKMDKCNLFKLSNRAVAGAVLPEIRLIDLNLYKSQDGLTEIALDEIAKRIERTELSLVFINRRGYSPVVTCYQCGWIGKCKNCSTNLVYHSNSHELKCHHCGACGTLPKACPSCQSQHLQAVGQGTQKIEEVLEKRFPDARVYRIDQDTLTSKSAWSELYAKIKRHEIDILVGTQILAKGHDFPNLTLVVGLNIDNSLYSYDFRASELLYTQLTQVAGRAGRGNKKGLVLLQTSYPNHELYQYLMKHDFSGFINYTMRERKLLNLPPYSYYALLRASGDKLSEVLDYLAAVKQALKTLPQVMLNEPVASVMQRLKNREQLHKFLDHLTELMTNQVKSPHGIIWQLDIDPFEL